MSSRTSGRRSRTIVRAGGSTVSAGSPPRYPPRSDATMRERFLSDLVGDSMLTGAIDCDVTAFLLQHEVPHTAAHCEAVAGEAGCIARNVGVDADAAMRAGWLHDISTMIPNADRIAAAHTLDITVLPEEAAFPMIVHQKLSAVLAREIF